MPSLLGEGIPGHPQYLGSYETGELEAVPNRGGEEDLEAVRERMVETLLRLRDTAQPYLDQVMEADQNDGHTGAGRAE